ncbi:copper homeostasis protein CutC [Lacticaseibacillus pabuli]|uniref:PF03932 family protein CutC n=1 Tax=Lacticaseibacillus pabuli TaxID=3025672 RepID=A0ABY7WUL6_9LACO|nr:copper homeostasis protein CutC [Lacticaseibacillus sp. KACC 23028]WDF83153.1 copper homeostasis protein CutC [Lacticaseibacillus sp. KACC 23028]
MYKELAVENFTKIPRAIKAGIDRIELNDNLAVGGTTVSHGVMAASAQYTREHNVPLVAMIRPRGGNFVYNETEIAMMIGDIKCAAELGVPAVTFGAVNRDGRLDTAAMAALIDASTGMDVVCHMAFDSIADDNQKEAIDWLVDHGVKRILTHGGMLSQPIDATMLHLREIVQWADNRIEILPGGGLQSSNAEDVAAILGVDQVHGSHIIEI